MAKLVASLSDRAKNRINAQAMWYHVHRDDSFTRTMLKNITDDIDALCCAPTIGRMLPDCGKRQYHVFISKKKCIIKYWFNSRTLYVVDVIFTDTHSPRIF